MHAQLIDDLIQAFGCKTQAEFGALLGGADRRVVNNWKRDGLPWKRRYQIEELAARLEVKLPESFRATKRAAAAA